MFSREFYIGVESGMLQKEAFLGRAIGGAASLVGSAVAAPFKLVGSLVGSGAKGAWNLAKFPLSGFKDGSMLKHIDESAKILPGVKGLGLKTTAGGALFSAPFAAMGAAEYAGRAGNSTVKAYNPSRSNLLSPVTNKSPMGNIF